MKIHKTILSFVAALTASSQAIPATLGGVGQNTVTNPTYTTDPPAPLLGALEFLVLKEAG